MKNPMAYLGTQQESICPKKILRSINFQLWDKERRHIETVSQENCYTSRYRSTRQHLRGMHTAAGWARLIFCGRLAPHPHVKSPIAKANPSRGYASLAGRGTGPQRQERRLHLECRTGTGHFFFFFLSVVCFILVEDNRVGPPGFLRNSNATDNTLWSCTARPCRPRAPPN